MYATVYAVSCGTCELDFWRAPLSVLSVPMLPSAQHQNSPSQSNDIPLANESGSFSSNNTWSFSHLQHTCVHLSRVQHQYGISSTALSWFSSMSQIEQSVIVCDLSPKWLINPMWLTGLKTAINLTHQWPCIISVTTFLWCPQGSVLGPVILILYLKPPDRLDSVPFRWVSVFCSWHSI